MFLPQMCTTRFTAIITVLSFFTSPILSAKVDVSNVTLIETPYDNNLDTLSTSSISTKYNLSSFLSNVVAKDGLSTTLPAEDDQELRYYQTGFRFDLDEQANHKNWSPVAVSTWQNTGTDLSAIDPVWEGVVVVSWKDTAAQNNSGSRVTFVVNGTDGDQQTPRRYAHVLLVENVSEKEGGGVTFDVIDATTVGGLLWYGKWLYVGNGKNGFRMFDLTHIWMVGKASAFGMEYILPQARMCTPSNFPALYRSFTFDFFNLDRNSTPPSILVGNFEDNKNLTYLAKWALDSSTSRLSTKDSNGNLTAVATWGYEMTARRVRGIFNTHGKYYIGILTTSPKIEGAYLNERGDILLWTPGVLIDPISSVLPRGVGGMAYSPDSDLMWAVSTLDGSKGVVGINAGGYAGKEVSTPSSTQTRPSTPTATETKAGNNKDSGGTSKTNTGAVVGGIIGGIAAGALLLWLLLIFRRRLGASRDDERQLTPPGADQYPSPGLDGFDKGEIPMIKPELEANSTQADQSGYASAVARSSAQSTGSKEYVEGAVRVPPRKPVPMTTAPVELPVVERRAEAPA